MAWSAATTTGVSRRYGLAALLPKGSKAARAA
jgi:hypothetical protein